LTLKIHVAKKSVANNKCRETIVSITLIFDTNQMRKNLFATLQQKFIVKIMFV